MFATQECLECLYKQAKRTQKIVCDARAESTQIKTSQAESSLLDFSAKSSAQNAESKKLDSSAPKSKTLESNFLKSNSAESKAESASTKSILSESIFLESAPPNFTPQDVAIPSAPPPCPPPKLAISVYERIAKMLHDSDPYAALKSKSIAKAKDFIRDLRVRYNPDSGLDFGLKIAVLGNVIDYGSANAFDIESCAFDVKSMHFGAYDIAALKSRLRSARKLVYIGDNAGEDVFDSVCVRILRVLYPSLEIAYFTRGAPIINDITMRDLHANNSPILHTCEVVDSGVRSAGFIYELANPHARAIYDEADVILAKGMGNFECLESCGDPRVFLLFKVKCAVVARFLRQQEGVFMLKQCAPESKIARI